MSEKAEATGPALVTIEVDGVEMQAPKGSMIIEATDRHGIDVPRFCYHRKLSIAANCRMCLVDVEKAPKPLPACSTPVTDGMKVSTRSERALKAQKGVMEFLLINHPLDCPICDQGGECELQDLALGYGRGVSRFSERKRVVKDENLGPLIASEMTRCIHCTRCVRFLEEVAGTRELGGMYRGEHLEISTYVGHGVHSEMSGNIIDLCPVGALTSRPYRFTARAWEMLSHPSVSPHDSVGSNLEIHHVRGSIKRVVPGENDSVNECWLADRDRFGYQGVYSDDRLARPMIRGESGWEETDWELALEEVVRQLRGVVDGHGADALGALVAGNATLEEQYLLGRLARGLGTANIDSRLRQADFSDQDRRPPFPWLGLALEDLERQKAVLFVGGNPRADQPIINHRLRKAVKAGARVSYINPQRHEFNYRTDQHVVVPSAMVRELALIAAALLDLTGGEAPGGLDTLRDGAKPGETHKALAKELRDAGRGAVLLGSLAECHPQASALRALAALIGKHADVAHGVIPEAANLAGAWLAGAVPHRQAGGIPEKIPGLDARDMLEQPRKGYLLLGLEPELDCADGAAAMAALRQAETVICMTPFVTGSMLDYATVLLPVAAFGETSGTFVSAEGRWQAFPGVAQPVGEARPGWRLLRVLGNLLELDGFDYNACDEIGAEVERLCESVQPAAVSEWRVPPVVRPEKGMQRIGAVPMYAVDSVVRRAAALQQTPQATDISVGLHPSDAAALNLADAEWVEVRLRGNSVRLPLRIDDSVAKGAVSVPSGLRETAALGPMFGALSLKRA